MIPVAEARQRLLDLVAPMPAEDVPLSRAHGRVLAEPFAALWDQPPFPAASMDGYAVSGPATPGAGYEVIGESAAGHGFDGEIGPGQAVRIFTGAPVPKGAERVLIQEDVTRTGTRIAANDAPEPGPFIRPAGTDFNRGFAHDPAAPLGPADLALLAAMGAETLRCRRRPVVAIMATGDELVMPGERPGPGQIVSSNGPGLAALIAEAGAIPRQLPIARDDAASLAAGFALARGADLLVTIGGASVGDHDLVASSAQAAGMERSFYKVAMRPGKPLMAGRLGEMAMIGLPGNPVSALVCGHVFLLPMLRAMLGLEPEPRLLRAPLVHAVPANGPREHYMRASLTPRGLDVAERQDSSLLATLARSDALALRPPRDPARKPGEMLDYLAIRPR